MLKFWRSLSNPITKTHQATVVLSKAFRSTDSMVVSGSHKVGSLAYNPPIGRKNATYIPLIVLAFLGVLCATDPTCYGNQKQPLTDGRSTFMFQIFDFDKQKVTNGGSQALLISSFAVKWFTNNRSRWRAESERIC